MQLFQKNRYNSKGDRTGDDDGQQNGIIQDPSGLGSDGSGDASDPAISSGAGGGRFIGTLGEALNRRPFQDPPLRGGSRATAYEN